MAYVHILLASISILLSIFKYKYFLTFIGLYRDGDALVHRWSPRYVCTPKGKAVSSLI